MRISEVKRGGRQGAKTRRGTKMTEETQLEEADLGKRGKERREMATAAM